MDDPSRAIKSEDANLSQVSETPKIPTIFVNGSDTHGSNGVNDLDLCNRIVDPDGRPGNIEQLFQHLFV